MYPWTGPSWRCNIDDFLCLLQLGGNKLKIWVKELLIVILRMLNKANQGLKLSGNKLLFGRIKLVFVCSCVFLDCPFQQSLAANLADATLVTSSSQLRNRFISFHSNWTILAPSFIEIAFRGTDFCCYLINFEEQTHRNIWNLINFCGTKRNVIMLSEIQSNPSM